MTNEFLNELLAKKQAERESKPKAKVKKLLKAIDEFCDDDDLEVAFRGYFAGQDFFLLSGAFRRVQSMLEKFLKEA